MPTYYLPAYFTASGLGATGLTVTVDVYRLSDNTEVITDGATTEIGGGGYFYSFTGQIDNYFYVFKTAAANVDQLQVAGFTPLQLMNVDAIPTNPLLTNDSRIPTMIASASSVAAISSISASEIWSYVNRTITSASIIMGTVVEGTYTVEDIFKITAAILAGKASGGDTTSITFRDLSDTLNRVISTVDASGNRSSITLNLG